jgi:molybdopterin/thiamine biosynthesis adenylyltransferase
VTSLSQARILVVGVGGLGCPAALALAHAGVGALTLVDDDDVARSNLHRQILFADADVGKPKAETARATLIARYPSLRVNVQNTRFLPENASTLLAGHDLVVEGSDNFATKFLVADACALHRVPVVHGAAIRWHGTAFAVSAAGKPCYRCVFEDIPWDAQATCDSAGVMGPVCGVVGALMADLALQVLDLNGSQRQPFGVMRSFDGKTDGLRERSLSARSGCRLCGDAPAATRIQAINREQYAPSQPAKELS